MRWQSEEPEELHARSCNVSNPSTNPEITAVFNASLYGTFKEIKGKH